MGNVAELMSHGWHRPPVQAPGAQTCPHAPQLFASLCVLTHALAQSVLVESLHETLQAPLTHDDDAPVTAVEHALPQEPQLPLSFCRSTQAPPQCE
jgi:hypothetical protein